MLSARMKRAVLTSFSLVISPTSCVTRKKKKAQASLNSLPVQLSQSVLCGLILGLSSGLDATKRHFGAKSTKSSLSWIIYDSKIST